jgi:3-hydroxyacyl-CoA dehydrogenase/peptidoglycan/xylan/chitin deacetylase (PgdA/CDA1 family)
MQGPLSSIALLPQGLSTVGLAVFSVLVLALFWEVAGGILIRKFHRALLKRRTRGKLVLTYDDGPGTRLENRVLDLLRKENARATFFLNARRSLAYGERVDRLKDAGHEVACHALEHLNAWRTPPWRVMRDINQAYAILKDWLTESCLYRPPYGRITFSTWVRLAARGIRLAFWTWDSRDTRPQLPEPAAVVAAVQRAGGGVVLMHSFDRQTGDHEEREQYVLEVTARLLELARREQWRVCCFSELTAREIPRAGIVGGPKVTRQIEKVAVLGGGGTIGSLAGGLLAQNGLKVAFIARSRASAERGRERAVAQARSEVIARNITCGDYASSFAQAVAEADWVLEAVSEDLEIKRQVYERVEAFRRPGTIVSSTTSSLPLTALAEGRSEDFRRHFLSTHFYNPPGRMRACEISGQADTDPSCVAFMADHLRDVLQRDVIPVRNVTAFAGNRIAFVLFSRITALAEHYGVELMDYLMGPYTGRLMPPLATLDLVGLDIHQAIIHSLQAHTQDALHDWLVVPPYLETMMARGYLGRKKGAGFYKKLESGKCVFYDTRTGDYVPAIEPHVAFVEKAKDFTRMGRYRDAFQTIATAEGPEAELVMDLLCAYVAYAYSLIGEVTPAEQDIRGIDTVMSSGFNWAPPSVILGLLGGPDAIRGLLEARRLPIPAALDRATETPRTTLGAGRYFVAR